MNWREDMRGSSSILNLIGKKRGHYCSADYSRGRSWLYLCLDLSSWRVL